MTERIADLKYKLSKWDTALADEIDNDLYEWINELNVTREEAKQLAKADGSPLQNRLFVMLEQELHDDEIIFKDDQK
jgi:hypothetical protein